MAVERRDIELALRVKDNASATFTQAIRAVRGLTSAIQDQAAGVAKGTTTLDELKRSYKELEDAGKALANQQGLIDLLRRQQESLSRYETTAKKARAAADEFKNALAGKAQVSQRAEQRLATLESRAQRTEAAFKTQQATLQRTSQAIEKAGIDTQELATASQTLLTTAQQAGVGLNALTTVISGYSRTVKEAQAAEQNAKRAAEFRALSDEANRLATSYGRLSQANVQLARARGGGSAEASVLSAQGRTPAQTLNQINSAAAAQAAAVQESLGKPVNNYLGLLQDLERSLRSVQTVARQIDGYRAQAAAVQATRDAFLRTREAVKALADENRRNPTAENANALKAALPSLNQAKNAYIEQLQALKVLREELRQAGVSTRQFEAVQKQLTDTAKNTTNAIKALNVNFDQFGGSRREGPAGFLGLRPFEIQNLSFQINDFFTQLASGASVTQAFAQQIGQVAQIQPIFERLKTAAPIFITLGAAIGVTVAALVRLNETASATRNFAANLSLLNAGFASGISPQELTRTAREVERLGFAFDDARKAALLFLREGVSSSEIGRATEAAARLSRVIGVDVAEAAGLLNRALTGGVSGLQALEERGVRFTDSQRRLIEAARQTNDQFQLQSTILDILAQRLRQADEQGLSPWTRAAIAAGNAWRGFLDELGRTAVFQIIESSLNGIARAFANAQTAGIVLARALDRVFNPILSTLTTLRDVGRSLGLFGGQQAAQAAAGAAGAAGGAGGGGGAGGAAAPTRTPGEIAAERERVRREREFERDTPSRESRLTTAQRVAAARQLAADQFREQFPQASQADIDTIANLAEIAIRQRIRDENERGGREAAAEIRRDFQAIQQDIRNTVQVRDEAIRGIQEDVAAGTITPVEAIQRIQEAADAARPSLQRLAEEARRFRDANRGGDAVRNAALDSLVAQAERQAGAAGSRAGIQGALRTQQTEVQRIVQERQALVQSQNALEQQGVISRTEAEERIRAGYAATNEELTRQIDLYRQANQAAFDAGAISEAAFRTNNAQIELFLANLQRVDPTLAQIKNAIEQTFVSSLGTALNTIAESLGNLLAGVGTLEDVFESAGKAALQFIADLLRGIAQAIIQAQSLVIIKTILASLSFAVPHSGGVVGTAELGSGRRRSLDWTAAFPRYHSGGIVGLAPSEQMIIAERGEEVLTRDDPRNILNLARGGGAKSANSEPSVMKNVLAIGEEQIAQAMASGPGERVMLNFLRSNAPTVRQIVRG